MCGFRLTEPGVYKLWMVSKIKLTLPVAKTEHGVKSVWFSTRSKLGHHAKFLDNNYFTPFI